jgi:MerR family Zn(II)-responsive transcriptional regulator of zntA
MLTIGKLAKQARVSTDSVRFYERQGLLSPATKTSSGYRLYSDDALRTLAFIKHAQRCGFSLADIRELLEADAGNGARDALCRKAAEKRTEIEETISELQVMSRVLSCLVGDDCAAEPHARQDNPLLSAFESRAGERAIV